MADPTISAITPANVVAGAAPVALALTGTNFAAGATVTAPGLVIQAVDVVSATSITALVSAPATKRGATEVTVTNTDLGTVDHAGPVVKSAAVAGAPNEYAYANSLPATTVGDNATGVQSLGSVVESGPLTMDPQPFVGGLGSPTEAGHFDLNPAYEPSVDQQGQQVQAMTPAQDAIANQGDGNAGGESDLRDFEGAPLGDHSVQIPNVPVITSAVAGGTAGHATATWTHAADADGYALSGYTVTATSSDGGAPATKTVAGNVLTADVTGLTSTKTYTFTVHATNAAGNSAESAASGTVVAPS